MRWKGFWGRGVGNGEVGVLGGAEYSRIACRGALRTPSLSSAWFALAGYNSAPSSPLPSGMNSTLMAETSTGMVCPKPPMGTGMVYRRSTASMGSKMHAPLVLASGSGPGLVMWVRVSFCEQSCIIFSQEGLAVSSLAPFLAGLVGYLFYSIPEIHTYVHYRVDNFSIYIILPPAMANNGRGRYGVGLRRAHRRRQRHHHHCWPKLCFYRKHLLCPAHAHLDINVRER